MTSALENRRSSGGESSDHDILMSKQTQAIHKMISEESNGHGVRKGQSISQENVESSTPNLSTQFDLRRPSFKEMIDQFRYNCGMFVNNPKIQFTIVILIAINAIMMGVGTYSFVRENEKLDQIFESIDLAFLVVFTVELFLQLVYHGWRLLLDGWLVFDLVIILTSWSFSSVQIIRAFRIFRALRLVTRIKIMKNLILGT